MWGMGQRALAPHTFGGFDIPRGSLVVISPFITQRDARFFSDSDSGGVCGSSPDTSSRSFRS